MSEICLLNVRVSNCLSQCIILQGKFLIFKVIRLFGFWSKKIVEVKIIRLNS